MKYSAILLSFLILLLSCGESTVVDGDDMVVVTVVNVSDLEISIYQDDEFIVEIYESNEETFACLEGYLELDYIDLTFDFYVEDERTYTFDGKKVTESFQN